MSHKNKDMSFDIIDTGDELKPFIHPQHWSETDNEWKTTGVDEPMPIILKDNDVIMDIVIGIYTGNIKAYSGLNRAVNRMQQLIDESE